MEHTLQGVKQRFGILGRSHGLDNALSTAMRVSSTDLTVLITGESGVGKEVFSKLIHNLSHRKHNPFIAINCGAIPAGTINSELFGHTKGAFTGASGERKGYFETVDGGTIFLDEIAEMPMDTQSYLLRVLQNGEFIRVGSSSTQRTDVRVIAATNVDLLQRIKEGKFREDLYYRLQTVPIKVPALRERKEDIYLLFRKFVLDFCEEHTIEPIQLDEDARKWLEHYHWPGNIRELKNVAEQLCVLAERRKIDAQDIVDLVPNLRNRNLPSRGDQYAQDSFMQEREILYKVLFDMKADLNDLKQLVLNLIRENNLEMSPSQSDILPSLLGTGDEGGVESSPAGVQRMLSSGKSKPSVIMDYVEDDEGRRRRSTDSKYDSVEVLEESITLEEMEKQMVKKALKKYKGKRKLAAEELGISERTLYRKIRQYELDL